MKIVVIGAGYVGMSIAVLLSQKHQVIILDTNKEKIKKINNKISPIKDIYIEEYLKTKKLNLTASQNYDTTIKNSNFVIICVPTNYDDNINSFDTTHIDKIINKINEINKKTTIVIKSTIPIGYINEINKEGNKNILYSPEFLRENTALYDNLFPSRIIISPETNNAKEFATILVECAIKKNIKVLYMSVDEAAAVKLFSNAYLAMRIAFFNELDTFLERKNLNSKNVIEGVCMDSRIGDYYNNPSFGYGGYCLPKDTKQLLSNYKNIPQNLIENIIKSNITRKKHIVSSIIKQKPNTVGVYRLIMKNESTNFRNSSIIDIINILNDKKIKIIIYEPLLSKKETKYQGFELINNIKEFKDKCDLILCNRFDSQLNDVINKVYTRDIFNRD